MSTSTRLSPNSLSGAKFYASFKKEEVYQRTKTTDEANLAQFSYIEGFYNSRRIISADGYLTPDEKEQLVN
ncbi:IS3 family transposase [Liquorilactobacillus nagelii]|uniref:IS3 family transposase n=1 Tax=Liquorilactobacillus nagelii TaxID=82688 RepID=UPI0039E81B8A